MFILKKLFWKWYRDALNEKWAFFLVTLTGPVTCSELSRTLIGDKVLIDELTLGKNTLYFKIKKVHLCVENWCYKNLPIAFTNQLQTKITELCRYYIYSLSTYMCAKYFTSLLLFLKKILLYIIIYVDKRVQNDKNRQLPRVIVFSYTK